MLSNVKPSHQKLHPEAAVWLRLSSAIFLNIYHSYRNFKSRSLFDHPDISTYNVFKDRAGSMVGSFKDIIFEIGMCLRYDMYDEMKATRSTPQPTAGEGTGTSSAEPSAVESNKSTASNSITYHVAKQLVNLPKLDNKRKSEPTQHQKKLLLDYGDNRKQRRCAICCCSCTYGDGNLIQRNQTHARMGHKTSYICTECGVVLCDKARFKYKGMEETCFQLFHSSTAEEVKKAAWNLCNIANPAEVGFATLGESPRRAARGARFKRNQNTQDELDDSQTKTKRSMLAIPVPLSPIATGTAPPPNTTKKRMGRPKKVQF